MTVQAIIGHTISIHAPMKGATHFLFYICKLSVISIHAPMKGATLAVLGSGDVFDISIHAPMKGATDGASSTLHSL